MFLHKYFLIPFFLIPQKITRPCQKNPSRKPFDAEKENGARYPDHSHRAAKPNSGPAAYRLSEKNAPCCTREGDPGTARDKAL